jgi:hypothetical protein
MSMKDEDVPGVLDNAALGADVGRFGPRNRYGVGFG